MKRIQGFDVIRGIAAFMLVVLHTGYHEWVDSAAVGSGSQESDPFLNVMTFFLTQGGTFYTILGAVNAFMIYKRLQKGKNTPKQLILGGAVMAFCLVAAHYFFRLITSADSGILYFLIRDGKFIVPDIWYLISTSTLPMLGITSFVVPTVIVALFHKFDFTSPKGKVTGKVIILIALGAGIVLITPLIRLPLTHLVDDYLDAGQPFRAWLLGFWVYDNFPALPFIGFGLIGSTVGILLATETAPKKILLYLACQATVWFVIGTVGIQVKYGSIVPELNSGTGPDGIFHDYYMHMAQLGVAFMYMILALGLLDFPGLQKLRLERVVHRVKRLGMISLTVYIFESVVTAVVSAILGLFPALDGWNEDMNLVILLGLAMAIFWMVVAKVWERYGYKGSVEWVFTKLILWISGKQSEKYDMSRLNVNPPAPAEK